MGDRPLAPLGIDPLHFSVTLFVLLILFVIYLLLPRGIRVHYFHAYPKRYVWSARSRKRRNQVRLVDSLSLHIFERKGNYLFWYFLCYLNILIISLCIGKYSRLSFFNYMTLTIKSQLCNASITLFISIWKTLLRLCIALIFHPHLLRPQ